SGRANAAGLSPFNPVDSDGDGVDDRIVFTISTGNPPSAPNYRALTYDPVTGTLLVGTTSGYELYRFTNLSGVATYTYYPADFNIGIDYSQKQQLAIRGAIVELRNASGTVLDRTNTDESGYFAFNAQLGTTVEIVVKAVLGTPGNATARVVDN